MRFPTSADCASRMRNSSREAQRKRTSESVTATHLFSYRLYHDIRHRISFHSCYPDRLVLETQGSAGGGAGCMLWRTRSCEKPRHGVQRLNDFQPGVSTRGLARLCPQVIDRVQMRRHAMLEAGFEQMSSSSAWAPIRFQAGHCVHHADFGPEVWL